MTRRLFAWLNLAWHFALHVTTRLWLRPFRHGRDLERFTSAVEPEGYLPLPPQSRNDFVRYMGCVQCGLCAIACDSVQAAPVSAWAEAWTFVTGASRSLDRAHLVTADMSASALDPVAQLVCPMGVPINHMAATFVEMTKP